MWFTAESSVAERGRREQLEVTDGWERYKSDEVIGLHTWPTHRNTEMLTTGHEHTQKHMHVHTHTHAHIPASTEAILHAGVTFWHYLLISILGILKTFKLHALSIKCKCTPLFLSSILLQTTLCFRKGKGHFWYYSNFSKSNMMFQSRRSKVQKEQWGPETEAQCRLFANSLDWLLSCTVCVHLFVCHFPE